MAEFNALAGSLERLRLTERYSDLTIECKGKVFKVHRAIVCIQSKVLAAMIDGNWVEAATSLIKLEDDSPDMISKMIDFFYKAQYDLCCEAVGRNDPQGAQEQEKPLMMHAQLYVLGDKYDIPPLKELAVRNYKDAVPARWDTEDFLQSAEIIYNNIIVEKDRLKDIIYAKAQSNISVLVKSPSFERLLRRTNNLATDILVSFIKTQGMNGNLIKCLTCNSNHILCTCPKHAGYGGGDLQLFAGETYTALQCTIRTVSQGYFPRRRSFNSDE